MAIKAWDDNSGHGPESPSVTDLSHLAQSGLGLNNGSSMQAGSTVSDVPAFGAPGTKSEGTSDLPYQPVHNNPNITDATHVDTSNNKVSG